MAALLLHGDTERSAALRHEIPLAIGDPFLFAEVDGRRYVLTSHLESERIKRMLPDAELLDYFELGYTYSIEDAGVDLSIAIVQSDDLNVSDPDDGESGEWKLTFGIKKNISFE